MIKSKAYKGIVRVKKGEKLHLNIPYEGRPLPEITWTKKEPPKETGYSF